MDRRRPAWLHGRSADLLLGAGLAYLLSLPLLVWLAASSHWERWPLEAVILLGLAVNTPHYGATLLRVYERREERRKYAFFTVWVSLALLALFVVGLRVALVGGLLITLYLSWSPWHFAGQNYGLSLMFLSRRGVAVPAPAKRALHLSFLLSFLLTLLVLHTAALGTPFAPDFSSSVREYEVLRLGLPTGFAFVVGPLLVVARLAALGRAAVLLRRAGASGRDLGLVGLIALAETCWFTVPAGYVLWTGLPLEGLAFATVWASTAHSAQYLWVTSYYAKRSGEAPRLLPYYGRALLAGSLIAVLPGIAATRLLGTDLSWTGGLAILVFSVVNLHHFVLDGAIWKLRDGRVARLLVKSDAPDAPVEPRRFGLRPVLLALGLACALVPLVDLWDTRSVRSRDLARLESAAARLAFLGRERMSVLSTLGDAYAAHGDYGEAERTYRHALDLKADPTVMNNLAWLLAVHDGGRPERAAEAVTLAEGAVARFGEDDYGALDTLAAAYAASGRYDDARQVAARALALARRDGAHDLVDPLASRLALYRAGRPYLE